MDMELAGTFVSGIEAQTAIKGQNERDFHLVAPFNDGGTQAGTNACGDVWFCGFLDGLQCFRTQIAGFQLLDNLIATC